MNDNQFPYEVREFDKMSIYSDMHVTNISVPLYKRMFLEAADAYDIALMILESEKWGVFKWADEYLKNETDIVLRLFWHRLGVLREHGSKILVEVALNYRSIMRR